MKRLFFGVPFLLCLLLLTTCGDDEGPCEEGQNEASGPRCCSGGCGVGTVGWLPRICKGGEWVCQGSSPSLEDACASSLYACSKMEYCGAVGIGKEEPDPAPELCCDGGCSNTTAVHRVCKSGTIWECPAGAVPVSRCKDYKNACGGILQKYRDNNFKLP